MPAEKKTRTIESVDLAKPVNFFNLFSNKLSSQMTGLHMVWDGYRVVVTHDSYPGKEKWILPGGINFIHWDVQEATQ